MTTRTISQIPAHVPPSLVLAADPWSSGDVQPHDWMLRVAGGRGLRYSQHNPLGFALGEGCWIAQGAEEISAILLDDRNFLSHGSTGVGKLIGEDLALSPLESDGTDHNRLRGLLRPLFQPKAVEAYRERISALAMDLIAKIEADRRCEFVQDYALKLPTQIFLELMGLPVADLPRFLEWENIVMGRDAPEKMPETWLKIRAYLAAAIEERHKAPSEDLLSRILAHSAAQAGDPVAEALGMAMLLFVAGLDTVVTALGWHFLHLAEHPEKQERLRSDPSLIPAAVDELLRAYAFTSLTRIAARDVEVRGVKIKAGDVVVCPSVLASRDSTVYADPAKVDFDRGATRHFAFGLGKHICIGMHLARLELIVSLQCWLANVPRFHTPEGYRPPWHGGVSLGLDALELNW